MGFCSVGSGVSADSVNKQEGPACSYLLDLVFVEGGNRIDDYPRQAPPEIHHLMHHETHDASSQHIVPDECVPRRP